MKHEKINSINMKSFNHLNRTFNQHLPAKENPQFSLDGKSIYHMMRSKYPEETVESLDNILNGMCASLFILTKAHVKKDRREDFIKMIHQTLLNNLQNDP